MHRSCECFSRGGNTKRSFLYMYALYSELARQSAKVLADAAQAEVLRLRGELGCPLQRRRRVGGRCARAQAQRQAHDGLHVGRRELERLQGRQK